MFACYRYHLHYTVYSFSTSHYLLMWQKADTLISTCSGKSMSSVCVSASAPYCRIPAVRRRDRYRLRRRWASLNAGDSLLKLIANAKRVWLRRKKAFLLQNIANTSLTNICKQVGTWIQSHKTSDEGGRWKWKFSKQIHISILLKLLSR